MSEPRESSEAARRMGMVIGAVFAVCVGLIMAAATVWVIRWLLGW